MIGPCPRPRPLEHDGPVQRLVGREGDRRGGRRGLLRALQRRGRRQRSRLVRLPLLLLLLLRSRIRISDPEHNGRAASSPRLLGCGSGSWRRGGAKGVVGLLVSGSGRKPGEVERDEKKKRLLRREKKTETSLVLFFASSLLGVAEFLPVPRAEADLHHDWRLPREEGTFEEKAFVCRERERERREKMSCIGFFSLSKTSSERATLPH